MAKVDTLLKIEFKRQGRDVINSLQNEREYRRWYGFGWANRNKVYSVMCSCGYPIRYRQSKVYKFNGDFKCESCYEQIRRSS